MLWPMIHLFFNKIRQLWDRCASSDKLSNNATEVNTQHIDEIAPDLSDNLDTACTIVTFYMREDGEFAVTTEMKRDNEGARDMTGTVLHMINSGLLSEYFLKSLNLWAEEHPEYQPMILNVIKKWKVLFDEDTTDPDNESALAIDPSDVFSLKSFSHGDFK